jgi:AraC-like DNA-binding protein
VSQPWFKGETPDTIFSPAAGVWWMEIDRQDLSLSLPGSRQPQLAQESVEVRGVTGGVDGVVRRALGSYPPDRFPSLDLLAERFAVSPRTMKRRLQQADSSYSALLAEVRFDFAADRLETSDQKITDLAFEAGYESAAAFSRAFRRFAGVTPREYRASRVN